MKEKKLGGSAFIPMLVFLILYLGSGCYFTITGVSNAWNLFPRHAAIFIGIIVACLMYRQMPFETKMKKFCVAAGNDGVVMMCMIFLVAGAFAGVAKQMGE